MFVFYCFMSDVFADDWTGYHYTAQGDSGEIDGIDDVKEFTATLGAFDLLCIPAAVQKSLLRVLTGLLLFGNISFEESSNGYAAIDVSAFFFLFFEVFCENFLQRL